MREITRRAGVLLILDEVMSCYAERFHVRTELEAFEDGEPVLRREWSFDTDRELG